MKAAEKDPAWRAAIKEDRVPPTLPAPAPAPAAAPAAPAAPDPAAAAVQATAKVGS
jgi:hypothetical protein